jgi:hypothetical protein
MDSRCAHAKGAEAYRGLLRVIVDCNHPAGGGTEEGRLADGHRQRRAAEAIAAVVAMAAAMVATVAAVMAVTVGGA